MKTSDAGRRMIESFEGLVLHEYLDAASIPTIGYGHRVLNGELFPNGITQAQADALLAGDLRIAEGAVNQHTTNIGQNMFDACVSLTFNIGTAGFIGSSVCKAMAAGAYLAAADDFLLWDKATINGTLTVLPALLVRRKAERARFLLDVSMLPPAA